MLRFGLIGAAITAICCFTPVLFWALAWFGVAAAAAWLDYVLLPLLAVFVAIIGVALWKRRRARS